MNETDVLDHIRDSLRGAPWCRALRDDGEQGHTALILYARGGGLESRKFRVVVEDVDDGEG